MQMVKQWSLHITDNCCGELSTVWWCHLFQSICKKDLSLFGGVSCMKVSVTGGWTTVCGDCLMFCVMFTKART